MNAVTGRVPADLRANQGHSERGPGAGLPCHQPDFGRTASKIVLDPLPRHDVTAADENPPIGIVLCTDKSEAVVRYTLPEDNQQIFASRYKLYLPTETELAAELQRERQAIEMEGRLRKETDE
jgi:hypothetical protein